MPLFFLLAFDGVGVGTQVQTSSSTLQKYFQNANETLPQCCRFLNEQATFKSTLAIPVNIQLRAD
jgi:hypothetical protein